MAQKEKKLKVVEDPRMEPAVETTEPESPRVEVGEERDGSDEIQAPRVIEASGVEKEQLGHTDCAEMEGETVETPQGDVSFKKVVTTRFLGQDVEKVVPVRESNENTLRVGEDTNIYNDWNDREFLIERIEGTHGTNADGRPERITAGFLDIAEDYGHGRIKDIDLPDHAGLRQWMHEYRVKTLQAMRYRYVPEYNIQAGVRFYFQSCLDHIKARKEKLNSEQSLGIITAQEYQNTRMLLELAEGAYRKFLSGEIVL